MSANSKIEWTTHTFNAWRGCTKVSDGCKNCYAETQSKRNPKVLGIWGDAGTRVVAAESYWRQPVKWNRDAECSELSERPRVFALSLGDWLEDRPDLVAPLARLLAVVNDTPELDWLLLTKRPENWRRRITAAADLIREGGSAWATVRLLNVLMMWLDGHAPPNVWLGTSIEDQATADERIPHLLRCPAAVRFISAEPLLGAVELFDVDGGVAQGMSRLNSRETRFPAEAIDWVIVGCEGGALRICWRTVGVVVVIFGVFLLTPVPLYVPAAIAGYVVIARIVIPRIP